MRLHMINILEEFQGKGIAQEVMSRIESMYPDAVSVGTRYDKAGTKKLLFIRENGLCKTGDEVESK